MGNNLRIKSKILGLFCTHIFAIRISAVPRIARKKKTFCCQLPYSVRLGYDIKMAYDFQNFKVVSKRLEQTIM